MKHGASCTVADHMTDIVSKLGRTNPGKVEEVLERVSTPQQLVTAG